MEGLCGSAVVSGLKLARSDYGGLCFASTRVETPHVNRTTRTATIIDALKRRALAVLNDESIDAQAREIIRHALEKNDPWLARLVRRAEARESIVDTVDLSQTPESYEHESHKKIEALAEIICAASEESAAALLVLMGTLQNSADPKAIVIHGNVWGDRVMSF